MARKRDTAADTPTDDELPGLPGDSPAVDDDVADVGAEWDINLDAAQREPAAPRIDRRDLVLSTDIALGNGNRKRGEKLGGIVTAVGVTLDEFHAALLRDDCRCDPVNASVVAILTTFDIDAAGRKFPAGSHLANVTINAGTTLGEVMTALRNHGTVLK